MIKLTFAFALILLSFAIIYPYSTTPTAFAASDCEIIEGVPNGPTAAPPPPCSNIGGGGPIVEWAEKIGVKLERGNNGYLSKLSADICSSAGVCAHKKIGLNDIPNKYWCTWLVQDAYALAGIKIPMDLVAISLYRSMSNLNNFIGLPYSPGNIETLRQVKPGYVIAFGGSGHIGIVKSMQIDDRGNGKIVTLESNSSAYTHTWPIDNGNIKYGGSKPILGFAGPK